MTNDLSHERHESPMLPAGLRERVLAASRHARAAGHCVPEVAEISPIEAFGRAAEAFDALLCILGEDDWHVPVVNLFDVQGLVGHLIAVELDVHRCIRGDPDVTDLDHVESTRPIAFRHVGVPTDRTRTQWRQAIRRTQTLLDSMTNLDSEMTNLDSEVAVHGLRVSLGTLLIVRAFELWTHENDIRSAVALAPRMPDGSTLHLMTTVAAGSLPLAAARIGLSEPTQVRLVLTGAGGGTWDVALGAGPADAVAVRIVADAAAFCRLAANRVRPEELDVHLAGDVDRANRVLAAVSALALD